MKRLQIPPKLVYKKFNVFEKILRTRNCCRNLWKIYFLKNAKKTCKPNNRDLNHDWIRNEILFSTRFIRLALHSAPYSKIIRYSHFRYFKQFLIFQINTDFLINQLKKYFYKKHPTTLLHFKKNLRCPSQKILKTSIFAPHFY